MSGTDADVTFTNDTLKEIVVQRTASNDMAQDLPISQVVKPGHTTERQRVAASTWPGQSSFSISFNDESVKIDIGTGIYKTDAAWSDNDGKIAGLLAPINFGTTDVDFHFWFYAGIAGAVEAVNKYLIGILQKVLDALKNTPANIEFPPAKLTITQVEVTNLTCTYASTTIPDPKHPLVLKNTVILKATFTIQGHISVGDLETDCTLTMAGFSTLASGTIDLSSPSLSPTLSTLLVSLDDFSYSGSLLKALEKIFPGLGDVLLELTDGYHVAAFLNSDPHNAQIVAFINTLLTSLFKRKSATKAEVAHLAQTLQAQPSDL